MFFRRRTRTSQDIIMCRRMVVSMQAIMLEIKADKDFIPLEDDVERLENLSSLCQELVCLINYAIRHAAERVE